MLAHAKPNINSALEGTVVRYTCVEGYDSNDDTSVTCNNENWVGQTYDCSVIQCPGFGVQNGTANSTKREYNTNVHVRCSPGFHIMGQTAMIVSCTQSGNWSPTNPHCSGKDDHIF